MLIGRCTKIASEPKIAPLSVGLLAAYVARKQVVGDAHRETVGRIRRAHCVRGKPVKEIARELRISLNTVRKIPRSGETSVSYEREVQLRPGLDQWKANLAVHEQPRRN